MLSKWECMTGMGILQTLNSQWGAPIPINFKVNKTLKKQMWQSIAHQFEGITHAYLGDITHACLKLTLGQKFNNFICCYHENYWIKVLPNWLFSVPLSDMEINFF